MPTKFQNRKNPALYEINTAAWLFELSKKLGKPLLLGQVPAEEWDRLKSLGMDFVWLMGVWSRSQEGRKLNVDSKEARASYETVLPTCSPEDILGSCYAIGSYGPDPLIGSWQDLDKARDELNKRGMGLILDFVPNHTGIDHHFVDEHPDYYIHGSNADYQEDKTAFFPVEHKGTMWYLARGRDPNFPPWSDTAQLNYFNPETRVAMIQRIEEISHHCDGIRCDMAMLVLNDVFQRVWGWANRFPTYPAPNQEFWTQAIGLVPNLIYIAEAYWDTEWTLQQLGFDYIYDKRLYDRLRSGHPHDVYLHLTAGLDYQSKLLRFIENHDELRSVAAFGKGKVEAVAALYSTLPGMKLFFHGQTEGKQIHLPIQIRQSKPESIDPEIQAFYEKLLPEVNRDIYHSGIWKLKEVFPDCDESAENLVAYLWKIGDSYRLVAVNLSQHPAQGRVCLQEDISESKEYAFTEILSGHTLTQNGEMLAHPGFILNLVGYQAQIWQIEVK
ncbi:MAG TPA: alpha-amylase family glycosyl hydrolase [Dehalococcoidales bacterium]